MRNYDEINCELPDLHFPDEARSVSLYLLHIKAADMLFMTAYNL
jgi:hypothetical protein